MPQLRLRRIPIGRRPRRPVRNEPRIRINRFIRAAEVRVISSSGEQLGIMDIRDAMRMAQEENLDLVEVAATEVPPVCRVMDFGKFQYDENKKRRESKKKQVKVEVKECKFRPKIGDHDFKVRIRRAVKFLSQGNKVKLTVMFRGREHAHPEIAERLLLRAFDQIKDLGKLEAQPKKEGRDMYAIVAPVSEDLRRKAMRIRAEKEGADKADGSPKPKPKLQPQVKPVEQKAEVRRPEPEIATPAEAPVSEA